MSRGAVRPQDAAEPQGDPWPYPTTSRAAGAGWWAWMSLSLACLITAAVYGDWRTGCAGAVAFLLAAHWHHRLRKAGR